MYVSLLAATLNLYKVGPIDGSGVRFYKLEDMLTLRELNIMLLFAYVAYLVTFKWSGWELVKFQYYQHEAFPNWSVFLSTDGVTTDVCPNERFVTFLCQWQHFVLVFFCVAVPPSVNAITNDKNVFPQFLLAYWNMFTLLLLTILYIYIWIYFKYLN